MDKDHLEDYRNPGGTMQSVDEIAFNWQEWVKIAFYCGTGFWAIQASFYPRIKLGKDLHTRPKLTKWSMNRTLPIEEERNPLEQ